MQMQMQMTRFQALAEAYGGDIAHWPAETRAAARTLLNIEPEAARALALAAEADARLDFLAGPRPSAALRDALIAAAPRPRPAGLQLDWRRLFLPGAGLAAAGLAGVIAGAVLSLQAAQSAQTDALVDSALVDNAAAVDDAGLPLTVSQTVPVRRV